MIKLKKINNKGFAISSILYSLLILFIVLLLLLLSMVGTRKYLLDKTRVNIKNELNGELIEASKSDLTFRLLGENPLYLEIGDTFTDPGVEVLDKDGIRLTNIEAIIYKGNKVVSKIDTKNTKKYIIKYIVNYEGESIYKDRSVIIRDSIAPTFVITGNTTAFTANKTLKIVDVDDIGSGLDNNPYSFDNCTTWQASNTKTITENGTYNLCVKDTNGNERSQQVIINKIDGDSPITMTLSSSGDSIYTKTKTITVTMGDNGSGLLDADTNIIRYGWSTSNTVAPSEYVTATLNYTTGATSATITITDSSLSGEYYLWVEPVTYKDIANNSNTEIVKSVQTFKFDNTIPTCTISGNPTNWVSNDVTLTVLGTDNSNVLDSLPYSWESATTNYSIEATKTVSENGTYIAYVKDQAGNVGSCESVVDKINKIPPSNVTLSEVSKMSNSITVQASADFDTSGGKYQFSINGGEYSELQESATKIFNELTKYTDYRIKVRAVSNSGLSTESSEITIKTNNIVTPVYQSSNTNPTTSSVDVTITFPDRQIGYVYYYSLDEGVTWKTITWPNTTKVITFDHNGTVIARINDGFNTVTGTTFTVDNIDEEDPVLTVDPYDVVLSDEIDTYNVLTGVNCVDDSNICNITTSGSVLLGVEGSYIITYTATDGVGKTSSAIRRLTIKTLSFIDLLTTDSSLGINEIDSCATTGSCAPGTAFAIKVNPTTTYKFNVVSDNENKVVLMMDRNIKASDPDSLTENADIVWISQVDYNNDTDWNNNIRNNKGPITALNELALRTSNWSNINFNYALDDDGGGNKYPTINKLNVHSRLITYNEAATLGCANSNNSCPSWMLQNLINNNDDTTYGYWTSGARASGFGNAYDVYYSGYLHEGSVTNSSDYGIRPVIELGRTPQVGTTYEFSYTGDRQEFSVPTSGKYRFELWGSQGGSNSASISGSTGSYVSGEINLTTPLTLSVIVGGTNGYNGGGASDSAYSNNIGGTGGGATDIRLSQLSIALQESLVTRIMTAGGGGGAGGSCGVNSSYQSNPQVNGYGHSYNGGTIFSEVTAPSNESQFSQGGIGGGKYAGEGGVGNRGDYRKYNPVGENGQAGSFGLGGKGGKSGAYMAGSSYTDSYSGGSGGGGGAGYFGGGGGGGAGSWWSGSGGTGGGGSSYISGHLGSIAITAENNITEKTTGTPTIDDSYHYSGYKFSNTKIIDGAGFLWTSVKGDQEQMPKPDGTLYNLNLGHSDSGFAKITYLGQNAINQNKSILELVTTAPDLGITAVDSCVLNGNCPTGTVLAIKVNPTTIYKFNVVSDNDNKMVLMMDRNIKASDPDSLTENANVRWVSKADYADDAGYGTYGNNNKGPITALNELDSRTSSWSNISFNYNLVDDGADADGNIVGNQYLSSTKTGVHARLLTYAEASTLGCQTTGSNCPAWVVKNTKNNGDNTNEGFWTSGTYFYTNFHEYAWYVAYNKFFDIGLGVNNTDFIGIRPVIEINRTAELPIVEITDQSIVTTGDGLYSNGDSYTFKGTDPNNYVTFNGEIAGWRIVSIDSDGSINLIKNKNLPSMYYNSSNDSNWDTPASFNTYLNTNYYNSFTDNAKNSIVKNAFSTVTNGYVGLITKEQYEATGNSSWLDNAGYTKTAYNSTSVYYVGTNAMSNAAAYRTNGSSRPMVKLKSTTNFTGTGTKNNPYHIVVPGQNQPPKIVIDSDLVIYTSTTSNDINYMKGIRFDDDKPNYSIAVNSNIQFGVVGTYTATYTVTDLDGNTTAKNRTVKVDPASIKTSYSLLYDTGSGNLPITGAFYDIYYNGNYNNGSAIQFGSRTTPTTIHTVSNNSTKAGYVLNGTNTYTLAQQSNTNRWINLYVGGGGMTTSAAIGGLNLIFDDNATLTLDAAVQSGYIEPLVVVSSSSWSTSYIWSNVENIKSGGNTSSGNYCALVVAFKVKSHKLKGFQLYSSRAFNTTYDGYRVTEAAVDYDLWE